MPILASMNILVISASPNAGGLTAACAQAAVDGIHAGGVDAAHVRLNGADVGMCRACNDGWGTCRTEHRCQTLDGFQALHQRTVEADGLAIVTPVYWGDMAESAKAFTDRLRRCEATRDNGESLLHDKPVFLVAAAGGSGRGTISCLANLERWVQQVHARIFDLIGVNRWSRAYKLVAIREASRVMAEQLVGDG
jgi:multimeric flavodoxin WrbA